LITNSGIGRKYVGDRTVADGEKVALDPENSITNGIVTIRTGGARHLIGMTRGGFEAVEIVVDPNNGWSTTIGRTSSRNIYYSSTNALYEIENQRGSSSTFAVEYIDAF